MQLEYWRMPNEKTLMQVFTFLLALMSLTIMICAVSFAAEKERKHSLQKLVTQSPSRKPKPTNHLYTPIRIKQLLNLIT